MANKDMIINKLIKIIFDNKEAFHKGGKDKEDVFKKVLDHGRESGYFSDKHDVKKVQSEFWRHQKRKYEVSNE